MLTALNDRWALRRSALAQRARQSLRHFIPLAWDVVEPGTPYKRNWHIDAICEHLEAVTAGEIKRLVINVPPGYSKSRTVTVAWPCWEWIRAPHLRYQCFSYSGELSVEHNMERRAIVSSPWYQEHWGDIVRLEPDDNRKTQFTNTRRGKMMATSFGGTATGKGGERLIVDDPLNPKQAASETELKGAGLFWGRTIQSRLRDKKRGAIVLVMQRLHEQDTSGLALDLGYEHLCLPAEYEPKRHCVTSIGWEDPRTKTGELLWPDHEGAKEVSDMKAALGSYAYAGQYQQLPAPEEGGIYKSDWFRYYTIDGQGFYNHGAASALLRSMHVFTTVDLAFSKAESADYCAIAVWGFAAGYLWLLDLRRDRYSVSELADSLSQLEKLWGVSVNWVEEGAFKIGRKTIEHLRAEGLSVRVIDAERGALKDKEARAHSATPRMEAGRVVFPKAAPWLPTFESEVLSFPNAANDDQVDVLSYGILIAPWRGGFDPSALSRAFGETSSPAREALAGLRLRGRH